MPRILRRIVVLVVLLGAWALIGRNHAPLSLTFSDAEAASLHWRANSDDAPYHLSALRIFDKVVLYVKDNYVDPSREDPKEMMFSALDYVEKSVPEVMVTGSPKSGTLSVDVDGHVKKWDVSKVDSLWKMSFTMKDVFDFLAKYMRPSDQKPDVEYAAINGMLSTLDPHSVLLSPDIYRDLQSSTKGAFGGIGFVIQMRQGNLTVLKVLPKTPAARAHIQKLDRIVKIGQASTINMDVNDAVTKLRGPVGSHVEISIARKGWKTPHAIDITRARITLESVQHKLLEKGVGYIRLKNFQGNTTHDLWKALADLRKQAAPEGGLKGLVLDLRGNPGGLLEQAVQVSDTFISHGTIVSTVGFSDKMREDKHAHDDDSDVHLPMAVLVNSGSASAAEIVSGALKNDDRATIIGQQTFGKGSVQMLYEFPDDSALKLTIAKYLTPGDVSIQEIGIEPDIQLVPTRVKPDQINIFAPRRTIGEADLSHHFRNPKAAHLAKSRKDVIGRQKPFEKLRFLKVASAKRPLAEQGVDADEILTDTDAGLYDQLDAEVADGISEDFEVKFARDYVLHAQSTNREKQLQLSKAWVQSEKREEAQRIDQAITKLGLNWSQGPTPKKASLSATLTPGPNQQLKAGSELDLVLTATNDGDAPLYRVHAWTKSDDMFLDRREFLFGELAPHQTRSWKVPIKLPKNLTTRREDLTVELFDGHGKLPTQTVTELDFIGLPRPAFAFNWQVVDDCESCNGNGVADRGEHIRLKLDVTNEGPGKALGAYARIRNEGGADIFIDQGRFKLGTLDPGQTKTAEFILDVKKGYDKKSFPLDLAVVDDPLQTYEAEKITLPVGTHTPDVVAHSGRVRATRDAKLYGAPLPEAKAFGELPKGGVLERLGTAGDFVKVKLDDGRSGFLRGASAHAVRRGRIEHPFTPIDFRVPPKISLNVSTSGGGVVAKGNSFTLTGTARDPKGLLDLYILVNDQKVAYQTAPEGSGKTRKMKFSATFPLKDGNNFVMVVARETAEYSGQKLLVIRKRPAAVAAALAREGFRPEATRTP